MPLNDITKSFKEKVCKEISLKQEGLNRYLVSTPFMFDDGDHLPVILKKEHGNWFLSDEGHTLMHISYDEIYLETDTRQNIIENIIESFGMENNGGELSIEIKNDLFGDSLFSFLQALIKLTDISYLKQERVRSTFMEDFKLFIRETIQDEEKIIFDYNDKEHDPEGNYKIDCRIGNGKTPIFLFGIHNSNKCRDATIKLLIFEKFKVHFRGSAIFQDQTVIDRIVLARFSDVCDKQFPSLNSAIKRFSSYLEY